jgi:uncharacterized protein (DUF342 family)
MLRKQDNGKRRKFGDNGKAWLTVETTEEGNAYLREFFLGGDSEIDVDDIVTALDDHYGIVAGVDRGFIGRILTQALKEPEREYFGKKDLLIASDVALVKPVDGHVEHKFLKMVTRKSELPYREMRAAIKQTALKSVLANEIAVVAARPGDELAVKIPPRDGVDGRDMFGNTTIKRRGREMYRFEPGRMSRSTGILPSRRRSGMCA